MKSVKIYTDGGCFPNPGGPGGYGAILVFGPWMRKLSGGFRSTTNNRMEIMAAIVGLEMLKEPCEVQLFSDSQYLIKSMTGRFRRGMNMDLWERLDAAAKPHKIHWTWIRGHNGHPENELCDQLATRGKKHPSQEDVGYIPR